MAKIKFGAAVADARNALGGTVFSKNQFGAYMRQKVSPVQKRNDLQQNVRARLQRLATYWSYSLDDLQRAGWVALAAANPITDVFGDSQTLTGEQMFVRVNANIMKAGEEMIEDAPANQNVGTLSELTLTADPTPTTGKIEIDFKPTPLEGTEALVVYATPGLPSGRTYIMNFLKMVVVSDAAQATKLDITEEWNLRFGLHQEGHRIWVKCSVLNIENGAESAALCAYADCAPPAP